MPREGQVYNNIFFSDTKFMLLKIHEADKYTHSKYIIYKVIDVPIKVCINNFILNKSR